MSSTEFEITNLACDRYRLRRLLGQAREVGVLAPLHTPYQVNIKHGRIRVAVPIIYELDGKKAAEFLNLLREPDTDEGE